MTFGKYIRKLSCHKNSETFQFITLSNGDIRPNDIYEFISEMQLSDSIPELVA